MITSRKTTVDKQEITIYETSKGQSWRLVHDGSTLVALFQSEGITATKNTLFEAATRDECIAEAQRLGLEGLGEWIAKDTAEQLASAYKTDKVEGETAFEYCASVMAQVGVFDVTTAISATKSSRIESGKISASPDGGGVKANP